MRQAVSIESGLTAEILSGVLGLTEQADILSLCSALYRSVRKVQPGLALRIYERAGSGDEFRMAGFGPWGARLAARPGQTQHALDLQRILRLLPQTEKTSLEFDPSPREPGESVLVAIRQDTELLAVIILQGAAARSGSEAIRPLLRAFANLYASLHRASHDKLTGLLNRQTFDERMARLVDQITKSGQTDRLAGDRSFYVIADIDHFKLVNDRFGHLMGDEVLLRFARLMIQSFRAQDLLFRFGGEEFVVLLNDVSEEQGCQVLERFREAVADTDFPQVGHVTCSIGFAHLDLTRSLEIVSERADKALYYAKEHGRNQVQGFEKLLAQGELKDDVHQSGDVDLF